MKRKRTTKFAACLWSALLLGGVGLPILAQEQDVKEEFQIGGSDTLTSEVSTQADSYEESFATDAEIDEIISGNLKADIHARDAMGNWTKQTITLKKENINNLRMENDERTKASGYINSTCYPDGHVSYMGISDGSENAKPTYGEYIYPPDSVQYVGSGTLIGVSKNEQGKWALSYGREGEDYWCVQMPQYEDLKEVKIRFHSDTSGKIYDIPLKENTYEGVYYYEYNESEPSFLITLTLKEYQRELAELTGSEILFGPGVEEQQAQKERIAGGFTKTERQVELVQNENGEWECTNKSIDVNYRPQEGTDGIGFIENTSSISTQVVMYRLYNPNSGEHFYTKELGERNYLVSLGWTYEGEGWNSPEKSSIPVYRLYNPNAGDHHYTTNAGERDNLVRLGWNDEGIGWYSDESQSVPVYRQYNPNAKAGSHNFTTSKGENDYLVSLGWDEEGIAWYGMK